MPSVASMTTGASPRLRAASNPGANKLMHRSLRTGTWRSDVGFAWSGSVMPSSFRCRLCWLRLLRNVPWSKSPSAPTLRRPGSGEVSQDNNRMGGWRFRSRNVVCCWVSGGSENPRDGVVGFREGGFLFGQVLIPGLGVPDLCPGSCANDGEFPAKTCILPERRRNRHAPLLVRYLVRGSREENTDVVTCLLGGNWSLPHLLVNPAEFRLTEDVDATLLAPCENQPAGKFLSELRGEDNSTFFIQTRRMCAEKHGPPPVCFRKSNVPCAATTLLRPPHYSTSLHSQRHARDV